MGVDVELRGRFHEPLTDEQLQALSDEFSALWPIEYGHDATTCPGWPSLSRPFWGDDNDGGRAVVVNSGDRYYGPDYARGPWERIRAMADWLTVKLGEQGEVRYGGDTGDGWDDLLPYVAQRAEIEQHWNTYGHRTYHWRTTCECDHCLSIYGGSDDSR